MSDAEKQNKVGEIPEPDFPKESDNTIGLAYGPAASLAPGKIVAQKYKVLEELGRGGMGVVYRVEQLALGRILAMKTLSTEEVSDIVWRRFQLEAKAAAMLDHPNLISVHDCGLINSETPYFVMDYIEGTTLAKLIKDKGALSIEETLTVFIQVCFGLAYAHAVGVVHRDLKPSNIMLVPPQSDSVGLSVKVVDFGIAKLLAEEVQPTQALTRTGEIFGSPLYMSPEQCLGKPVDYRSDIYSLGCVLFETLTGLPPFMGATALSTMMQHQSAEIPSLKEATLGKEFPPAIENILRLMLEKNPESRYQDMKTIARDLSLLQQGISHHPQISTETKAEVVARSNKKQIAQVLGALLLGAAISGVTVSSLVKADEDAAYQRGFTAAKKLAEGMIPSAGEDYDAGGPISSIIVGKDGKSYRLFKFGNEKGFGMGYIILMDKERSVPAKGTLLFPVDEPLRFDVEDKIVVTNPNFLLRFDSTDFTGMRFRFNFGVNDGTFRYLDRQKQLKYLDVTSCDVSGALIEQLNKLPNLETLKVGKTNLMGQDLLRLKRLGMLKTLNIAKISGQGEVLKHLKNNDVIEDLRISADGLSHQDLQNLGTMRNLKKLWIERGDKLSDADLAWIANLHQVKELCIFNSQITKKFGAIVSQLPHLELFAPSAKYWSTADIADFKKQHPKVSLNCTKAED